MLKRPKRKNRRLVGYYGDIAFVREQLHRALDRALDKFPQKPTMASKHTRACLAVIDLNAPPIWDSKPKQSFMLDCSMNGHKPMVYDERLKLASPQGKERVRIQVYRLKPKI